MPIIKTIPPQDATGELKELYDAIVAMRGGVGNNALLFSTSPELLRQQMDFIKYYMTHSTLSMPLLASIRILVSSTTNCEFCIDFNTGLLINMAGWTFEQVQAMRENLDDANLPAREIELLRFALKAIKDAHSITAADMDALRAIQWSDKDILDAVNHASRMLAIDVIFNTFKIEKDF